jgi:chaperone required for assembly of F1-ATPase
LERATLSTKSFIIGLAVVKKHLTVEEAAQAASAEVNSQIEVWGEVEDSECNFLAMSMSTFVELKKFNSS